MSFQTCMMLFLLWKSLYRIFFIFHRTTLHFYKEQTSCRDRGWGSGNWGSNPRWWSWYGGSLARHKWICLRLERCLTVLSGSPSRIQLLLDWTRWCRRGRGFVCMHFPRSLCSQESWREFTGTGFYYFLLPAVAGQSMVPRYDIPSRQASSGAPRQDWTFCPKTVTSVPWRGNERCVPGHISFVPVSDLLRLYASDSFVWPGFIASWFMMSPTLTSQLHLGLISHVLQDLSCKAFPKR